MNSSRHKPALENEEFLWELFREGDKDALGNLARIYYRVLYNYAKKFSRDPEFIKDCIQELFLKLWDKRENISKTVSVRAYLFKAIRNTILDEVARLQRFQQAIEPSFDTNPMEPGIDEVWIENEMADYRITLLTEVIAQLSKRQQEIIYLRFYEGLTTQETAEIMGLGYQSVSNLLYRTLKELKEAWVSTGFLLFLLSFSPIC
ncbi:RNA polymerase sigma factor [Larkinella bovis]|uniref:RNA polymerase sigma factor n=1 Tax=Larkinella bovis TaxID=683041 RepID=A0ABW0IDD1_9BACT